MRGLATLLVAYVLLAYIVLPAFWRHYEHHPALADAPKVTTTPEGIPGDPLNVGLVGTRAEVVRALLAAGWMPADPITWRTSLRIAESVLFHRPDPSAPVSTLMLYGRRQDFAFERDVGGSARQRHHVRLWQSPESGRDGRPLWLGSATFDRGVGVSHRTGQITHHIAPDVDSERDTLIADLTNAGQLLQVYQVTGVGPTIRGRNGGGDWYYTDGELTIGVLVPGNELSPTPPVELSNPAPVRFKNHIWDWLRHAVFHKM